jgi:hypothetical protein
MGKDGVLPQASGFDAFGMGKGKNLKTGESSFNSMGEAMSKARKLQTQDPSQKIPKK